MTGIVSPEFDEPEPPTDVSDPDTSADARAAQSLRDADRIEAWCRCRIAARIREAGLAMNAEMMASMIESGCL